MSSEYILGRVSSILKQELKNKTKMNNTLITQFEVRSKNKEWKQNLMSLETLEFIIQSNLDLISEIENILKQICIQYDDCSIDIFDDEVNSEDQLILDYINKNPNIKNKILTKLNSHSDNSSQTSSQNID